MSYGSNEPNGPLFQRVGQHIMIKSTETMAILILAFILLVGLVLAAQLVRMGRAHPGVPEPVQLEQEAARLDRYEPMVRLFAGEDSDYLALHEKEIPQLKERLGRGRRKVLALFLRDIRRDFRRAWSLCRLLAPVSNDPEFGAMLSRQLVSFYVLFFGVRLRLLTGAYGDAARDVRGLVDAVQSLRETSQHVIQAARAQAFQSAAL